MRVRLRAQGATVWELRFGGLTAVIGHDPDKAKQPWHWQLDAWTKFAAIQGDVRSCADAVRALEKLVGDVAEKVRCVVGGES